MKGLVEGSDYEFRVIAVNEAGESKPSDSCTKFTAKNPYTQPSAPIKPVAKIVKKSSQVTWSPPSSDGKSKIISYKLEFKDTLSKAWKTISEDIKDTSYIMDNLEPGKEIEFRVSALNKAGYGPTSTPSNSIKYGKYKYKP